MEPLLGENDKLMFYDYLNKASYYFEYGGGGSTFQASVRNNMKKIYSVESDPTWLKTVKDSITFPNIQYFYNEMDVVPDNWGNPGFYATDEQKRKYSNYMSELTMDEKTKLDLVMIDGRFRVACCLKCFNSVKDECPIIFDDFLNRTQYHVVLQYFDIVETTTDYRMVVLKKKKIENIDINLQRNFNNLISTYELIPN